MKPKSAKGKGSRFERFIASEIADCGLDSNAKRQPMSGAGFLKGDIHTSIPWTLEAKHQKKPIWFNGIDQARREARQGNANPDNWALIVNDPRVKPEFSEVYVVIDFWKFLDLLKANQLPKSKEPDRALKYDLQHLKQIANKVIKKL